MLLSPISFVLGFANLVCMVLVLIKIFDKEGLGRGVLALICGLYAFIWGWQNATRYEFQKLMTVWSVLLTLSVIVNFFLGTHVGSAAP